MTNLLVYIFIFLFSFFSFGFNVDLTKPNDLMNVIYHETTNFEEHKRKEQNAINRGNTGAGIFGLKNFGNENTNGMSKTDWIIANADKDTISNGTLGLVSDLYNTATKKGEGEPQVVTATATVGTAVVASGIALATAKFIKDVKDLLSDTLFNSDNSSGQEPENMNNDNGGNDNNGGDKEPENPCLKNPELCAVATEETVRNSDKVEVVHQNLEKIPNYIGHISDKIANLIEKSERIGHALKKDLYHYAPSFFSKNNLSQAEVFSLENGKKLVQTMGNLNGKQGVFEWILNKDNQIVHQLFKVGRVIDGIPVK